MSSVGHRPRSYLFAPGDQARLLTRVFTAGADAVVLDLEDGVAPSAKAEARRAVAAALVGRQGAEAALQLSTWVRINCAEGADWREDVVTVVGPALTGIRLPKAESPDAVCRLDEAMSRAEESAGLEPGTVELVLTVESAVGISRLTELATCSPRVAGFTLGAADLVADLGANPDTAGLATLFSASRMVIESVAAGLAPPVAPVFTQLDDDAGLGKSTRWHRNLGFFGRSAIHPRQIPIIHEAFTPTAAAVERAQRIVDSHREALAAGDAVSTTSSGAPGSSEFIDPAVVRQARSVLALAAVGTEPQLVGELND